MAFIDYYKILGVDKNIPQNKVRAAYLKRTKQFHPDLHPDDPKAKAKFQALNEAYDVISDPEKRKKYDQYGGSTGSPFEGFDFSGFGNGGGGFSSFFNDLFGSKASSRGARHSSARSNSGEMNASVNIDLYTALLGGEVVLQLGNGAKVKLKVKPETQNGTRVRLRGKGYDRGDGTFGDMIITYNVTLPTGLTDRQKELLRQMQLG